METTRQKKIAKLIQKDLSVIFNKEISQFLGNILVTITRVRVSSDFSVAKLFLSIFPANDPEISLRILNKNKTYFRNLLGRSIRHQIRIIPELIFYLDDSAEYTETIERLLDQ